MVPAIQKTEMNLAAEFARHAGKTVSHLRGEFDGDCIAFAGELIAWAGRGRLAYFDTPRNAAWKYHAAALIDGAVHDLWSENPEPLESFTARIGADFAEFPAEEP